MAGKRIKIIYHSTEASYEDLKQVEHSEGANNKESFWKNVRIPRELLIHDIHIADQVFQPRMFYEDEGKLSHTHVLDLIAGIKSSKYKPLEPILVHLVGSKYYLVDGHHRYAAYCSIGWNEAKPVPVEVFKGTLDEAVLECGLRNNKNKLPMSRLCKQEFAWNLVKLGIGSIKDQHCASGVAKSTVSRMRSAYETLGAEKAEGMRWLDVLRDKQGLSERDSEQYFDAKALELSEAIKRATDIKLVKHYDVLANAIDLIHPSLRDNLISHWTETLEI